MEFPLGISRVFNLLHFVNRPNKYKSCHIKGHLFMSLCPDLDFFVCERDVAFIKVDLVGVCLRESVISTSSRQSLPLPTITAGLLEVSCVVF